MKGDIDEFSTGEFSTGWVVWCSLEVLFFSGLCPGEVLEITWLRDLWKWKPWNDDSEPQKGELRMRPLSLTTKRVSPLLLYKSFNTCQFTIMTSDTSKKRKARGGSISPPPLRAKKQSSTTSAWRWTHVYLYAFHLLTTLSESAVASFFTPQSQKPAETTTKTIWQQRSPHDSTTSTLLVGKYNKPPPEPVINRRKVAAFDFVGVMLRTYVLLLTYCYVGWYAGQEHIWQEVHSWSQGLDMVESGCYWKAAEALS